MFSTMWKTVWRFTKYKSNFGYKTIYISCAKLGTKNPIRLNAKMLTMHKKKNVTSNCYS